MRGLSRRITTSTGNRLVILVNPSQPPVLALDENLVQLMRIAMSRLYDPNTRVMNLARFRDADELRSRGFYLAIDRPNVLRAIMQLIKENAPGLLALNMSDNRIHSLETFKTLSSLSIKAIDLSKNKV